MYCVVGGTGYLAAIRMFFYWNFLFLLDYGVYMKSRCFGYEVAGLWLSMAWEDVFSSRFFATLTHFLVAYVVIKTYLVR